MTVSQYDMSYPLYRSSPLAARWPWGGHEGPRTTSCASENLKKEAILVMGGYKVIHPSDSRVDLGSSHHLMHNGEGIKLVSPKVDEKSMCEGNAYV